MDVMHWHYSHPMTDNKITITGLVANKLSRNPEFVDRNNNLMYDEEKGFLCKFITTSCNLQAHIAISNWWKQARKWIPTSISRLQNNKIMAMKEAFLEVHNTQLSIESIKLFLRMMASLHFRLVRMDKENNQEQKQLYGCHNVIHLDNLLEEGRKNKKLCSDFFSYLMPCIMKKTVFESQVSVTTSNSTCSIISDEGFMLLLQENSFNCWIDPYLLQEGQGTAKDIHQDLVGGNENQNHKHHRRSM
jgi:hypothetical protein